MILKFDLSRLSSPSRRSHEGSSNASARVIALFTERCAEAVPGRREPLDPDSPEYHALVRRIHERAKKLSW